MAVARFHFRAGRPVASLSGSRFAARRVAVRVPPSCLGVASSAAPSFRRQRPGRSMTR